MSNMKDSRIIEEKTAQTPKVTLSEEERSEIEHDYIHGIDKLNRMSGGRSSTLEKVEEGIIHINMYMFKELTEQETEEKAIGYAKSWYKFCREKVAIKGYVVTAHTTTIPPGGCFPTNSFEGNELWRRMVNQEGEITYLVTFIGFFVEDDDPVNDYYRR
jgi:hypothetical protein